VAAAEAGARPCGVFERPGLPWSDVTLAAQTGGAAAGGRAHPLGRATGRGDTLVRAREGLARPNTDVRRCWPPWATCRAEPGRWCWAAAASARRWWRVGESGIWRDELAGPRPPTARQAFLFKAARPGPPNCPRALIGNQRAAAAALAAADCREHHPGGHWRLTLPAGSSGAGGLRPGRPLSTDLTHAAAESPAAEARAALAAKVWTAWSAVPAGSRSATALVAAAGTRKPPFRWQAMRQQAPSTSSGHDPLTLRRGLASMHKIPSWATPAWRVAGLPVAVGADGRDVRRIRCSRSSRALQWTSLPSPAVG